MTGILVSQRSRHNDYSLPENIRSHNEKHARKDFFLAILLAGGIAGGLSLFGNEPIQNALHNGASPESLLFVLFSLIVATGWFAYRRWQDQIALLDYLEETIHTDALTGIFNRNSLDLELEKELSRARRYNCQTSVLMVDIDHFKTINDLYGHKIGDRILQHISKCIAHSIRISDTLGRYGGEEFMAILPQTSQDEASIVAERVRQYVLNNPLLDDGEQIITSVSIGVAEFNPTTDTADKLVDHSDQALFLAKHAGRNRVHCWTMH